MVRALRLFPLLGDLHLLYLIEICTLPFLYLLSLVITLIIDILLCRLGLLPLRFLQHKIA